MVCWRDDIESKRTQNTNQIAPQDNFFLLKGKLLPLTRKKKKSGFGEKWQDIRENYI